MTSFRWIAVVVLSAAGLLAGCSTSPARVSSAAPPVKICGQTVSDSAAGVFVFSYTQVGTFHLPKGLNGSGQRVVLRFVSGCSTGVRLLSSSGFKLDAAAFSSKTTPAYKTVAALVTRTDTGSPILTVVRPSGSTTRIVF
jgi:hypothetical protein